MVNPRKDLDSAKDPLVCVFFGGWRVSEIDRESWERLGETCL